MSATASWCFEATGRLDVLATASWLNDVTSAVAASVLAAEQLLEQAHYRTIAARCAVAARVDNFATANGFANWLTSADRLTNWFAASVATVLLSEQTLKQALFWCTARFDNFATTNWFADWLATASWFASDVAATVTSAEQRLQVSESTCFLNVTSDDSQGQNGRNEETAHRESPWKVWF
ncbi:hypothetical protein RB12748 [Rhodopirellula baltica SH 1]|uniref:Uncharacterized protein n=1 Tax=Rhodopirellula baltica (strain DSM 10527 / NCIMB 13988 / SH1) TaxID=243090 RepID=Q7UI55_RHOBA|nr:hypothetical protein RB12748 [Rhodopirellula baltica SH 1]